MPSNPSSARQHMSKWKHKPPIIKDRVLIKHAIIVAGNENRLANLLGITRSAVYQWQEPYRLSPYLPRKMANKILSVEGVREKLHELNMELLHELLIDRQ